MSSIRALSSGALVLLALGCGSSGPTSPPPPPPPPPVVAVKTIVVTGQDTLSYRTTVQLSAVALDSVGDTLTNRPITWASSNPSVATVSQTGLVSYAGPGEADISASSGNVIGQRIVVSLSLSFVAIGAGPFHSCGLTPRGELYCWGHVSTGWNSAVPTMVPSPVPLVALGVGDDECALSQSGAPYCRTGPATAASSLVSAVNFKALSQSGSHGCGISTSDLAFCWGYNNLGQLGTESPPMDHLYPAPVSGGLSFTAIAAGINHTCGVAAGGAAYCWGSNSGYQLGSSVLPRSDAPAPVIGGLSFVTVAAGFEHTCGIATDSTTYCWGRGDAGRLGSGATATSIAPLAVSGNFRSSHISLGLSHTCALTTIGTAFCWGANSEGELGSGGLGSDSIPVAVAGGRSYIAIAAGQAHTCALTAAGVAYCWGDNQFGELGVAAPTVSPSPVKVTGQP
jgi:hypothetical protein